MKKGFAIWVAFVLLSSSCREEKVDTKAFSDELKDRKILHVTQGEISSMAEKAGRILTDTLTILLSDCKSNCCEASAFDVVGSFCKDFEAEVKFVPVSDSNSLGGLEKEVFEAYLYLLANKLPMEPNVQNLKNGYWLFSQPVVGEKLNCTENKGSPFAGVWNIKMSQKMLIRNIGK